MLAITLAAAFAMQGTITSSYDDVRDVTTEEMLQPIIHQQAENSLFVGIGLRSTYTGQSREAKPEETPIVLAVFSVSETWQFLKYNDTAIVFSGQRKSFNLVKADRDINVGHVTEVLMYPTTIGEMKKIANSDDVKMAVGSVSFRILPGDRDLIRKFCNRLTTSTADLDELERREKAAENAKVIDAERERVQQRLQRYEVEDRRRKEEVEKAAVRDLEMAERLLKLEKPLSAEEWVDKARGKSTAEKVVRRADSIAAKIAEMKEAQAKKAKARKK